MISELARNTSWRVCLTHTNLVWSFNPDRLRRAEWQCWNNAPHLCCSRCCLGVSKLRLSGRKVLPTPFWTAPDRQAGCPEEAPHSSALTGPPHVSATHTIQEAPTLAELTDILQGFLLSYHKNVSLRGSTYNPIQIRNSSGNPAKKNCCPPGSSHHPSQKTLETRC